MEDLDRNQEALVAVILALAAAIDGLDHMRLEDRTAKNFMIVVDAMLDDLPNMPGNEQILEPVSLIRRNIEIALDKVRRTRGHGGTIH